MRVKNGDINMSLFLGDIIVNMVYSALLWCTNINLFGPSFLLKNVCCNCDYIIVKFC